MRGSDASFARRLRAGLLCGASVLAAALSAEAAAQGVIAIEDAPGAATARLIFLPEDLGRLDAPAAQGETRYIVTGAYSSGEAYRPEGFTIRAGDPTRPYPQGWDGLLVIEGDGEASIHDVSRVRVAGRMFNLRDAKSRDEFVALAAAEGFSVVQSHLLIRDGALDIREIDGAPIARRRVLFQTEDGRIGIFDSAPELMTLYDAARAVEAATAAEMAFNLDMGTYDYCEVRTADGSERCGVVGRGQVEGRLTNLLELSIGASSRE